MGRQPPAPGRFRGCPAGEAHERTSLFEHQTKNRGHEFESLRARQLNQKLRMVLIIGLDRAASATVSSRTAHSTCRVNFYCPSLHGVVLNFFPGAPAIAARAPPHTSVCWRGQAEILVLRHHLNVLRRKSPGRLAFSSIDRMVFAGMYALAPNIARTPLIWRC